MIEEEFSATDFTGFEVDDDTALKLQDSRLERRFSMEMRSITMMSPSSMKNMEAMKTFMIDDSFSFK